MSENQSQYHFCGHKCNIWRLLSGKYEMWMKFIKFNILLFLPEIFFSRVGFMICISEGVRTYLDLLTMDWLSGSGTWRLVAHTKEGHGIKPWAISTYFPSSQSRFLTSLLILSSHPLLGPSSGCFQEVLISTFCMYFCRIIRAKYRNQPPSLISPLVQTCIYHKFSCHIINSSLLGPNMLMTVLFSNIRSEDFSWTDSFTSVQNNWRNYCLLWHDL